jgi:SAM-dependent methyltransferase
VWKEICHYLQPRYIPNDASVLELGAGYCDFINNIRGRSRHAVDIANTVKDHAAPSVVVHVRSCVDLNDLASDYFDVVFASNLLEHLTRPELLRTLAEVRRVLTTRGRLVVVQPNFRYAFREYFDDYTHVQIFTDHGLADLLVATGFLIVAVQPRFLPFSLRSRLPKSAKIVRLYLHLPFRPFAGQMLVVAQNQRVSNGHSTGVRL